jgi:hypothetical protein
MSQPDDVARFERRAGSYESGPLGHWHRLVAERTAEIALQAVPSPRAVLGVGCGTGVLLRLLAERLRGKVPLLGLDPSPAMIAEGSRGSRSRRARAVGRGGRGGAAVSRRSLRPRCQQRVVRSLGRPESWSARGGAGSRSGRPIGACRSLRPVAGDHDVGWATARSYACSRGAAARPGTITASDLATGLQLGPSAAGTGSGGGERPGCRRVRATTPGVTNGDFFPPREGTEPGYRSSTTGIASNK